MSFVDHVIAKRQFAARYRNVGRAMLANLADMYCTGMVEAERWADEIDRETDNQIAAASPLSGGGIAGTATHNRAVPAPSRDL